MDADERALFAQAVDDAVAGRTGADLDATLAQLGWADALASDAAAAVELLFEAQGRAAATSGALDLVLGAALGPSIPAASPVLLPPLGTTDPPGRARGAGVEVRGLGTRALANGEAVLVVVLEEGGRTSVHECLGLTAAAIGGLDPRLGLVEVTGTVARDATISPPSGAWEGALAAGHRALAHELVGASRTMLDLARQHTIDRIQFGVPIASFQAVRHRLADAYVAIESTAAVAAAAWDQPDPMTSAAAKAIAGRHARLVAKHCQQVLAGVGFTAEHPFHLYLRRTRLLDGLLGDARTLTRAQGEQLLHARALPPVLPL